MVWDTIAIVDAFDDTIVSAEAAVYSVAVIDSHLWVGTDQATVRLGLWDFRVDGTFFYVDSSTAWDEVYAYPVPYSNSSGAREAVNFRFALKEDAEVTLEIYDVAMNLVRRVFENRYFPAGFYQGINHEVGSDFYVPAWDGFNGKGDQVAVGVYYFKVMISGGDVRWGKLAVIP